MLQSKLIEFALLPLRIIAGVGLMIHGLPKILDIGKTRLLYKYGSTSRLGNLDRTIRIHRWFGYFMRFLNKNCSRVTSNRDDRFYSISENIKRIYWWF